MRDPNQARGFPVGEAARLAALWGLAAGTAHTLNNALTTIAGEASFLRDDRKEDGEVVEACEAILVEVARCARLTRFLLARRHPSQDGSDEVDLGRLVDELGRLLVDALGRRIDLRVEVPENLVLIRGDAGELEVLAVCLTQYLCDLQPGGATLRLTARGDSARQISTLHWTVETPALPVDAALRVHDPSREEGVEPRLKLQASHAIVASRGGELTSTQNGDRLEIRASFPALQDTPG